MKDYQKIAIDCDEYADHFDGFVGDLLNDACTALKELQSRLESLEKVKVYKIGEATNRLVFQANGIENVSDMQRVFDAVEVVLESLEKDAALLDWLGTAPVGCIRMDKNPFAPTYINYSASGGDIRPALTKAMQASKGE